MAGVKRLLLRWKLLQGVLCVEVVDGAGGSPDYGRLGVGRFGDFEKLTKPAMLAVTKDWGFAWHSGCQPRQQGGECG